MWSMNFIKLIAKKTTLNADRKRRPAMKSLCLCAQKSAAVKFDPYNNPNNNWSISFMILFIFIVN